MRKQLIVGLFALALAVPFAAPQAADKGAAEALAVAKAGKSVTCSLCVTCGGTWPIFAGAFSTPTANTTERGSSCSGTLTTQADSRPFLCCRRLPN